MINYVINKQGFNDIDIYSYITNQCLSTTMSVHIRNYPKRSFIYVYDNQKIELIIVGQQ